MKLAFYVLSLSFVLLSVHSFPALNFNNLAQIDPNTLLEDIKKQNININDLINLKEEVEKLVQNPELVNTALEQAVNELDTDPNNALLQNALNDILSQNPTALANLNDVKNMFPQFENMTIQDIQNLLQTLLNSDVSQTLNSNIDYNQLFIAVSQLLNINTNDVQHLVETFFSVLYPETNGTININQILATFSKLQNMSSEDWTTVIQTSIFFLSQNENSSIDYILIMNTYSQLKNFTTGDILNFVESAVTILLEKQSPNATLDFNQLISQVQSMTVPDYLHFLQATLSLMSQIPNRSGIVDFNSLINSIYLMQNLTFDEWQYMIQSSLFLLSQSPNSSINYDLLVHTFSHLQSLSTGDILNLMQSLVIEYQRANMTMDLNQILSNIQTMTLQDFSNLLQSISLLLSQSPNENVIVDFNMLINSINQMQNMTTEEILNFLQTTFTMILTQSLNGTNSDLNQIVNYLQILQNLNLDDIYNYIDANVDLATFLDQNQLIKLVLDGLMALNAGSQFELTEEMKLQILNLIEQYQADPDAALLLLEQSILELFSNFTNIDMQIIQNLQNILPNLINSSLTHEEIKSILDALFPMGSPLFDINDLKLSDLINFLLVSMNQTALSEVQKNHLDYYIPELIAKLSQVTNYDEAWTVLYPIVKYHIDLYLNNVDFSSTELGSGLDVLYADLLEQFINIPQVSAILNSPEFQDLIMKFSQNYFFTMDLQLAFESVSEDFYVFVRTQISIVFKEIIQQASPQVYEKVKEEQDVRVLVAGMIHSYEDVFHDLLREVGIPMDQGVFASSTSAPIPTTTTTTTTSPSTVTSTSTTTERAVDQSILEILNNLQNQQNNDLQDLIGNNSDDNNEKPFDIDINYDY